MVKSTCHNVFCYGQLSHVIPASTYRLVENAFTASSQQTCCKMHISGSVSPKIIPFIDKLCANWTFDNFSHQFLVVYIYWKTAKKIENWQAYFFFTAAKGNVAIYSHQISKFINKQVMRMLTAIKIVHFKEIFKLLYKLYHWQHSVNYVWELDYQFLTISWR